MKNLWIVVNAVCYDGVNAYVTKFIVRADEDDPYNAINPESEELIAEYIGGAEDILKIDPLFAVNFDNILAYRDSEKPEDNNVFKRFSEMYFAQV